MKTKNRASKARVSKIPSKPTSAIARVLSETVSFNGVDDGTKRLDQSPALKRVRVSTNDGTCITEEAKSGNELGNAIGSCSSSRGFCAAAAPTPAVAPAPNNETTFHKDGCGNGLFNSSAVVNWECQQTFEWTVRGLCIKCNEGGQVLICGNGDCPLAVHECCLGYTPSFDDKGKYYCPFCSYKQAVSECDEMEKELASAKEKVHVARDLFCVFVNGRCEKQTIQMKEHRKSMEMGGKESPTALIHQQEAVDACGCINEISRVDTSLVSKGAGASRTTGEQTEEISGPKQKSQENHQVAASAADFPCDSHATERCGVVSGADIHSKQVGSSRNSTVDQQNVTATTDVSIPNCETQGKPECSKSMDPQDKSASEQGSVESAEDENLEKTSDSKSLKSNKPAIRSTNPAIPNSKRKKLGWTREEEEMLKEAVEKFSSNAGKNLSWKSILGYGSHVFNASRTPVDLKDKWRNMVKGKSRGRNS